MQFNHKLLILFCTFLILCTNAYTQVSNIKTNVNNDQFSHRIPRSINRSSKPSYNNLDFGESLASDIFYGIIQCIGFVTVKAQKSVLQNKDYYPNTISFEAGLDYGTNFNELTFNPSVRGNWGIIGSELRYALLHDNTGSLESIDWQVLIVRIPVKNFKFNYGIGFTTLLSPNTTYLESSTEIDLNLCRNKLNINTNYRWTAIKSDVRYRQELKITADYLLFKKGAFHLSPMLGITYQDYFKANSFLMFNSGIRIRFLNN